MYVEWRLWAFPRITDFSFSNSLMWVTAARSFPSVWVASLRVLICSSSSLARLNWYAWIAFWRSARSEAIAGDTSVMEFCPDVKTVNFESVVVTEKVEINCTERSA